MSSGVFCLFSLISLLLIPGICNQELEVHYQRTKICALKGSTVPLLGSFKNLENLTLTETFWTLNSAHREIFKVLDRTDYKGRVEPNKNQTLIAKLSNVTKKDEGTYTLEIETNEKKERFVGFPGIVLIVTELSVEIPKEVIERDSPVLLCKTTCILTGRAIFTWYKNNKPLPESYSTNQLMLQSVSSDDAGNYSCAVRDQKHLPSPAVTLNVRYPPKNVSVSVSPSAVIVEGDSVTLICSSDSNPPALNFSWFKENQTSAVGSGQSFFISSFTSSHSGRFYCEAQNKYGSRRSASVSVTVKESSSSWIMITVGITTAAVMTFVILMVSILWLIRRKRVTPSDQRNHRGSRHNKTVESPESTYMTLDPKSRCSEYDTLDNMKRSSDDREAQDPVYCNIGS